MHKEFVQQTMAEIIKRAETGRHTPFEYIRNWTDYRRHKISCHALKLLIKSLTYNTKSMLDQHCKAVINGCSDVSQLLVRNVLLQTIKFYEKELAMIEDIINEYEAYLMDGNILNSWLFNVYRPSSECWDRRGVK